jgi:hypothetical protein
MSLSGPNRQFAAVQRCVSFWRRTRRLAAAVNTAAHDPKEARSSVIALRKLPSEGAERLKPASGVSRSGIFSDVTRKPPTRRRDCGRCRLQMGRFISAL